MFFSRLEQVVVDIFDRFLCRALTLLHRHNHATSFLSNTQTTASATTASSSTAPLTPNPYNAPPQTPPMAIVSIISAPNPTLVSLAAAHQPSPTATHPTALQTTAAAVPGMPNRLGYVGSYIAHNPAPAPGQSPYSVVISGMPMPRLPTNPASPVAAGGQPPTAGATTSAHQGTAQPTTIGNTKSPSGQDAVGPSPPIRALPPTLLTTTPAAAKKVSPPNLMAFGTLWLERA